ncbi:hypothetical protein [Streptomyces sp. NPDC091278]|uniref:hypothetical protein n=1 Tax=Streptomyces sp. NPDC091278 TaxID=3155301 RepID=UPI00344EBBA2
MALIQPPMLTHGGTHPARAFRMMVRDLARGQQGVTEGNDLRVRQLPTAGPGVLVGDGSAVVRGAEWAQGSYTQYNVGDTNVPIVPGGANDRHDLLLLRIEDPEYDGNRNPAEDDVGYFHVIPGVSATTTTAPAGMTAIPLARIAVPANTYQITDGMITDLRQIANPRRERSLATAYPASLTELRYQDGVWRNWPPQASWQVAVPPWATQMRAVVTIAGLRMDRANVYATMQVAFGALLGDDTVLDDDQGPGRRRTTAVIAHTLSVPSSMRGTTQTMRLQTMIGKTESGDLSVDGGTSIVADVEWVEGRT